MGIEQFKKGNCIIIHIILLTSILDLTDRNLLHAQVRFKLRLKNKGKSLELRDGFVFGVGRVVRSIDFGLKRRNTNNLQT